MFSYYNIGESFIQHFMFDTMEKAFKCSVCQKLFSQEKSLEVHMQLHNKEPLQFSDSNTDFSGIDNIKEHKRIQMDPFQCTLSSKSLTKSHHLRKHLKIHSEKPFLCFECNERFSCKSGLLKHMKIHNIKKPFQCSICLRYFSQHHYVKRHMRIHTGRNLFQCSECTKCYTYRSSFLKHMKVHMDQEPLNDECDQDLFAKSHSSILSCSSKDDYDSSSQIEINMFPEKDTIDTIDPLSEVEDCSGEQFQYTKCTKSFSNENNLNDDIGTHTKDKSSQSSECHESVGYERNLSHYQDRTGENPLYCLKCNKSFFSRNDLDEHMALHTRKKFVQCPECHKYISTKGNLSLHMRVHTQEKPYECSECRKCFPVKSDLIKHLRVHTGEKPFKCSECSKVFSQKRSLVEHKRIHTGEKPFHCLECPKSFTCKGNLTVHIKSHTGEKPFPCPNCHKSYRHKASLIKHMEGHYVKESYDHDICNQNGLQLHTSHNGECVESSPGDETYLCHVTKNRSIRTNPSLEVINYDTVKKEVIDYSDSMICNLEESPGMFSHVLGTEIKEEICVKEEFEA